MIRETLGAGEEPTMRHAIVHSEGPGGAMGQIEIAFVVFLLGAVLVSLGAYLRTLSCIRRASSKTETGPHIWPPSPRP